MKPYSVLSISPGSDVRQIAFTSDQQDMFVLSKHKVIFCDCTDFVKQILLEIPTCDQKIHLGGSTGFQVGSFWRALDVLRDIFPWNILKF